MTIPCPHLLPGPNPLEPRLVIDAHLGPADFVARCRRCTAHYLLEMIDINGSRRAYRYAALDHDHAERFLHNLSRGSCDVTRAGAEVLNLATLHPFSGHVLITDVTSGTIIGHGPAQNIPTRSWRDLPCDGGWCDVHAAS